MEELAAKGIEMLDAPGSGGEPKAMTARCLLWWEARRRCLIAIRPFDGNGWFGGLRWRIGVRKHCVRYACGYGGDFRLRKAGQFCLTSLELKYIAFAGPARRPSGEFFGRSLFSKSGLTFSAHGRRPKGASPMIIV